MNFYKYATSAVLALLVVGLASSAGAQGSRDAEAKAMFQAARVAYDAGRYDDALTRFKEAYRLSGRHELLFNIGQTADRLRKDAEALEAFEAFLEKASPDAAGRETAEARVAFLKEQQAKPTGTTVPTPEEAAASQTSEEPPPVEEPPKKKGSGLIVGLAIGGGVAIAAAVIIGVVVASQPIYADTTNPNGTILLLRGQR